jgi:hypothetical protein
MVDTVPDIPNKCETEVGLPGSRNFRPLTSGKVVLIQHIKTMHLNINVLDRTY